MNLKTENTQNRNWKVSLKKTLNFLKYSKQKLESFAKKNSKFPKIHKTETGKFGK
jgi:hypothetical protein